MPGRHRSPAPTLSQWRARVACAGAGACAGLIGQAIGLGLLQWPSGGLPGFPWWQPPAAYAEPGHGTPGPEARELPVAEVAWFLPAPAVLGGPPPGGGGTPQAAVVGPSTVAPRAAQSPAARAVGPPVAAVPDARAGGPPVAAVPDAPSTLTGTVGATAHAVVGGVVPAARSATTGVVDTVAELPHHVVATAGEVVHTTTDVVGTATEVPHRVVDTAGAVVDTVAKAPVARVPAKAVDTVEDVVGEVSGKQDGKKVEVARPVLETVTSAVHLPR